LQSSALRIVGTIVGVAVALQSLRALADIDPPNMLSSAAPVPLAVAAIVLFWRSRPLVSLAILALFAAIAVQAFALFGDSLFARTVVGAIACVLLAFIAWAYVVLPILAWRRGRWPVEAIAFVPLANDQQVPEPVRQRMQSLAAQNFVPRLVHARAEGRAAATIIVLAHHEIDAFATVTHITLDGRAFTNTRLTPLSRQTPSLSIVDAAAPSPFPAQPAHRVLLFPGADAATLLEHYVRLRGKAPARLLSDDDLAAQMAAATATNEQWLVDAGYLDTEVHGDERRYTLKGGFSAVLRMLWPWAALERARLARNARDALRAASGPGAA
jgi:hypothetical protein